MLRRFLALAFALVLVTAPLAVQVCEAACAHESHHAKGDHHTAAGHDGGAEQGAGAHHSHHTPAAVVAHSCQESQPASGTAMAGGTHACGHAAGMPMGLQEPGTPVGATSPAILPAASSTIMLASSPRRVPRPAHSSPPPPTPLRTPLRI